jgi:hypothetical protein
MKNLLALCCLLFFLFFTTNLSAQCATDDPTSPVGIVPTQEIFPGGGPQCEGGFRLDPVQSGTYDLDAFGNKVQVVVTETDCGPVFSWTIIGGVSIDKIYVKGGPDGQNVYDYSGVNPSPATDGYLHSPLGPNDKYSGLSHIDFCFSYKLDVSKTAETSFKRTYEWDIDKECEGPDTLLLNLGQTYNYPFSWTASVVDSVDSAWNVSGTIKVKNSTPFNVSISSITDFITGGFNVDLDCNVTFPYLLASGDSLVCTYTQDLPDASARTNKVVVISGTSGVEGDSASVNFDFLNAVITKLDTSVTVTDDCQDPVVVHLHQSPFYEEYTCPVGPFTEECGDTSYINRVSFETADLELTGSDSCVVLVTVTGCDDACTLTPGYWKTHSQLGPAPYDDTWKELGPLEEQTPFFLSGQTYYQVLWTAPAGNAYYILAHAYIAAELNKLNNASMPQDVQDAFDYATNLFSNYTPAQIGALKGAAKNVVTSNAKILDDYNNGLTGPGHCSDDSNGFLSKDGYGQAGGEEEQSQTQAEIIPDAYTLSQNYPNPFNPGTSISFGLPEASYVSLKIYDLLGNEIVTLVNDNISAGMHRITFDASNLPSGVYIYKLQAGSFIESKKMVLMK